MGTKILGEAEFSRGEDPQKLYERISERLSCGGRPLKILNEGELGPQQLESVKSANKVYLKLGCLLEELALQSANMAAEDKRCEKALCEIAVISEFVVQVAERNSRMKVRSDRASERPYRNRGDDVKFWVGEFEYQGETIDFSIMVRSNSYEVLDDSRPGVCSESRQARLAIELRSISYNISMRIDPESTVCMDVKAPALSETCFGGVNQRGKHHFYTDIKMSAKQFEEMLKVYIFVFDSMTKAKK